ncbi:hypothetical protein BOO69_02450 [Sulfitobacter alexandrii]|uniref:Uncharacterized protein n=1 Tax=Sulfitobacter alexandrii TaxID=1917485 RepID=A0A1J0WDK7_9RHOB|nr:hypothetical protein [Sulfitobacter alexandrii]APE42401.1 hypothetical protein BOO69_02450 [Sulfitobacter alexandrii]
MRILRHLLILMLTAGLLPWCGLTSAWAATTPLDPAIVVSADSVPTAAAAVDPRAQRVVDGAESSREPRFLAFTSLHCNGAVGLLPSGVALDAVLTGRALLPDRAQARSGVTRAPPRMPPRVA